MYLTHLSLTNFRSFSRLDLDLPRRVVLLLGDNAQGKTTFLEAVYFLAAFTSFHAANDRQVINLLAMDQNPAVCRLVADFQRAGKTHHLEVRLIVENNGNGGFSRLRKEILLDGIKHTASEAIGLFNAVIFLPQMSAIIEDGPDERRRYLNMTLSQVVPGFAAALSDYSNGINQRNALLKQLAERGGSPEQLEFWDELVARRGAQIILARDHAVQELERLASEIHQKLTRSSEVLRMIYQPAYDPCGKHQDQLSLPMDTVYDRSGFSLEEIQKGFAKRLTELRQEEIFRGVTTIGPHRDDLRFLINHLDLSDFGSRGQIRTVLLALKLAEVQWMCQKTGETPVLLLDEIMAELDDNRREDLLTSLAGCDQSFLTTTDIKLFDPKFVAIHQVWKVKNGRISGEIPGVVESRV